MKYKLSAFTLFLLILLLGGSPTFLHAQNDPNTIGFEAVNGHPAIDQGPIGTGPNDYYPLNYGITFDFIDASGGNYPAVYAKIGPPQTAFATGAAPTPYQTTFPGGCSGTTSDDDHPVDTPPDEGCFFLTDDNGISGPPGTLRIRYDTKRISCTTASGYILDVDGNEAFLVRAYNIYGAVDDEIVLVSPDYEPGIGSIPAGVKIFNPPNAPDYPGETTGDSRSAFWQLSTFHPIQRIEISYVGDPEANVGLAFDLFSFCRSGNCPEIEHVGGPFTTGFGGSGDHDYYVHPIGIPFCTIIQGDDPDAAAGDLISMSWDNGIPGASFSVSGNHTGSPSAVLCWSPTPNDIGTHTFTVRLEDCAGNVRWETFNVQVICPDCELTLYLEDRNSGSNPLNNLHAAGKKIVAGEDVQAGSPTGPVNLSGTFGLVEFKAGQEVNLQAGFQATANGEQSFRGSIEQVCPSVDECVDCCEYWSGFTIDLPLNNVFTPDGDGINEFWAAEDDDNPNCAYGARGYALFVYNRWGNIIYSDIDNSFRCCAYVDPNLPNTPPSIHWDGRNTNGQLVNSGTYFIVLKLFGCDGEELELEQDVTVFGPSKKEGEEPDGPAASEGVSFYPNPATDEVNIELGMQLDTATEVELLDLTGRVIIREGIPAGQSQHRMRLGNLPSGTYLIRLHRPGDEHPINEHLIKL